MASLVAATPASAVAWKWTAHIGCRWAELEITPGKTGFTRLKPERTGLNFLNAVALDESLNGSGVAAGDFDNDGWCDLYFTALEGRHRLYRNLGNWKFEDVTAGSGVEREGQLGKGACFVDLDGDGNLDLLISATCPREATEGGLCAFAGDGRGHFRDVTKETIGGSNLGSHTVAAGDIDGNGTLDLYVSNAGPVGVRERKLGFFETIRGRQIYSWVRYDPRGRVAERVDLPIERGRPTIPESQRQRFVVDELGEVKELGPPDFLMLGDGRGRFVRASWTDGRFRDEDGSPLSVPPLDFGLAASFRDVNGDGAPDIYVCNDFHTPDRLWFGDGKGGFRAAPRLALRQLPYASMGVDFGDFDRDGHVDFYVVEMLARSHERRLRQTPAVKPLLARPGTISDQPQIMRNALYRARGDGTWADIAEFAGVAASEWSWQPVVLDVDLDGFEDLIVANGHPRDSLDSDASAEAEALSILAPHETQKAAELFPVLAVPKVAFRNCGNLTFEEVGKAWGLGEPGINHGLAEADFDHDGDLDIVMSAYRDVPAVFRNNSSAPRVAVRLRGRGSNWTGVGAKVTLRGGAVPEQMREVFCGGRYHAGSDPQLCFAAGKVEAKMRLEVHWRSGARSTVEGVRANRLYEIHEP